MKKLFNRKALAPMAAMVVSAGILILVSQAALAEDLSQKDKNILGGVGAAFGVSTAVTVQAMSSYDGHQYNARAWEYRADSLRDQMPRMVSMEHAEVLGESKFQEVVHRAAREMEGGVPGQYWAGATELGQRMKADYNKEYALQSSDLDRIAKDLQNKFPANKPITVRITVNFTPKGQYTPETELTGTPDELAGKIRQMGKNGVHKVERLAQGEELAAIQALRKQSPEYLSLMAQRERAMAAGEAELKSGAKANTRFLRAFPAMVVSMFGLLGTGLSDLEKIQDRSVKNLAAQSSAAETAARGPTSSGAGK